MREWVREGGSDRVRGERGGSIIPIHLELSLK